MASVNTLFSTNVVVRNVQGYTKDSWGTSDRYGTTTWSSAAVSSFHCLYRIAALRMDSDSNAMSSILVTGGIFNLGGILVNVSESRKRNGRPFLFDKWAAGYGNLRFQRLMYTALGIFIKLSLNKNKVSSNPTRAGSQAQTTPIVSALQAPREQASNIRLKHERESQDPACLEKLQATWRVRAVEVR